MKRFKALKVLSLFLLLLSAAAGWAEVRVVATTTMLADLVQSVGGPHVAVDGLMGPGIDPHLYQASAGDVGRMQNADVVVYNGLHLEGKMGDVFAALARQGQAPKNTEDLTPAQRRQVEAAEARRRELQAAGSASSGREQP